MRAYEMLHDTRSPSAVSVTLAVNRRMKTTAATTSRAAIGMARALIHRRKGVGVLVEGLRVSARRS